LNLGRGFNTIPGMAEPDDGKPGNFTVADRRTFDANGERKDEGASAPAGSSKGAPKLSDASPPRPEPPHDLPPADFATLVLSLGSSVLMYMGEGPEGNKAQHNLPMAKHAIDMLTVLEEKTKGNLSAEEEHILESLLFDLRLRYVEALKAATTSPAGT
jgi:hypothetical protein